MRGIPRKKHATAPHIVYHIATPARKSLTIKAPHHADRVAHRPTPRHHTERPQMFGRVRVCICFLKSAPSRTITADHYTRPKNFFPLPLVALGASASPTARHRARTPCARLRRLSSALSRAILFKGSIAARLYLGSLSLAG